MEAFIPLLCLMAMTILLWSSVLKRHSTGRPVVWNWRMVGAVTLGAIGAFAVPIVVVAVLRS